MARDVALGLDQVALVMGDREDVLLIKHLLGPLLHAARAKAQAESADKREPHTEGAGQAVTEMQAAVLNAAADPVSSNPDPVSSNGASSDAAVTSSNRIDAPGPHPVPGAASNGIADAPGPHPVSAFRLLLLPDHFRIEELQLALPYSHENVHFLNALEMGR